jgi:hypothetical protein
MGAVFKKTATKPLPTGAKIIVRKGQRLAEWKDAKGKTRTAPLTVGKDGTDRLVITARTYTAKYRDGSGIVREVATGCRDESAARSPGCRRLWIPPTGRLDRFGFGTLVTGSGSRRHGRGNPQRIPHCLGYVRQLVHPYAPAVV